MNNLSGVLIVVLLVISGVYFLDMGPNAARFFTLLFEIPEWHHATAIQGLLIRGMYLFVLYLIVRLLLKSWKGNG